MDIYIEYLMHPWPQVYRLLVFCFRLQPWCVAAGFTRKAPALLSWLSVRSLMVALTTIAQCGTSDAGRPAVSASFCYQQWHQSKGSAAKPTKL